MLLSLNLICFQWRSEGTLCRLETKIISPHQLKLLSGTLDNRFKGRIFAIGIFVVLLY